MPRGAGRADMDDFPEMRPVYNRKRRARAHVSACLLVFYLVHPMEQELRAQGEGREVEPLLWARDDLRVAVVQLRLGEEERVSCVVSWAGAPADDGLAVPAIQGGSCVR